MGQPRNGEETKFRVLVAYCVYIAVMPPSKPGLAEGEMRERGSERESRKKNSFDVIHYYANEQPKKPD